jgi:hypothetical protein
VRRIETISKKKTGLSGVISLPIAKKTKPNKTAKTLKKIAVTAEDSPRLKTR